MHENAGYSPLVEQKWWIKASARRIFAL